MMDEEPALEERKAAYVKAHPEIRATMALLMSKVLEERPENVAQAVAAFFMDPGLERAVSESML